tara:strand:+ start:394 stop:825 length:432 start_codon:yes stop_codon:yes gene_type:complete
MENSNYFYSDNLIKSIFRETKTIAIVGASPDVDRPSYRVMNFLKSEGFKVYPVNPQFLNEKILGEKVLSKLSNIEERIDLVNIFRRSEFVEEITKEAISVKTKTIWMQLGIENYSADILAKNNNIHSIMNRCTKLEYIRLCKK